MELNQIENTNDFEKINNSSNNNNISNKKIKVAVMGKGSAGFGFCEPTFHGFVVDIWKITAKKYNLDYEFTCVETSYDEAVLDVSKGKYDVALGDFSVIKRRFPYVDFTRPFFISKMQIFKQNKLATLFRILYNFVIRGFLIFSTILLIFYTLLYKYFNKKSLLDSFYFVLLHIFSDDTEILSLKIRGVNQTFIIALNIIWILLRYVFFAIVITQLIEIIIRLQKTTISDKELRNVRNVDIKGGGSHVDFVKLLGKNPIEHDTIDEVFKKMQESPEDNIYGLGDYLPIINVAQKQGIELIFTEHPQLNDESAMIVNKNRKDILEKLNNVIIELRLTGKMREICYNSFTLHGNGCIF
jgi:ABC-type amino acid transport substrate-binding protein